MSSAPPPESPTLPAFDGRLDRDARLADARRRIVGVGLLSVVAHVVVLFGVPMRSHEHREEPVARITLVTPPVPLPASPPASSPTPPVETKPAPPRPPLSRPKPPPPVANASPPPVAKTPVEVVQPPQAPTPAPSREIVAAPTSPAPVSVAPAPPSPEPLPRASPPAAVASSPVPPQAPVQAPAQASVQAPATSPAVPAAAPRTTAPGFAAGYLANPQPDYPAVARRRGEQGTVYLRVRVSAEGVPLQVVIDRSSGSPMLDRAAQERVASAWRFTPARRGDQAVEGEVIVPIVFRLATDGTG